MRPDFLGIGAQKAGTTWLHANLARHPDVWLPYVKELHYFNHHATTSLGRYLLRPIGNQHGQRQWRRQVGSRFVQQSSQLAPRRLLWEAKYLLGRPSDAWYSSLFQPAGQRVCGEFTPAYATLDSSAVAHAARLLPQAKILFFVRNPIERAWSHAVMDLVRVRNRPGAQGVDEQFRRHFQGRQSVQRSTYLRTIDRWTAHYPAERFFMGWMEDVSDRPAELLHAVHRFLGLDPELAPPPLTEKVNSNRAPTMPTQYAVLLAGRHLPVCRRMARRFGGHARTWLAVAERLLQDPPDEPEIRYPLADALGINTAAPVELASGPLRRRGTDRSPAG